MYRYSRFSSFASRVARTLGHPVTFMIFLGAALLWLATGPLFHFSGNWYSAYSNTATIVTTLLLFLIQHTQSREIASIQFKLNEIIRVSEGAHNALLDIEEMTDRDYDRIKASYTLLARQAREQLQNGKVKWATARVSMESLDSFLDPSMLKEDDEPEETSGESAASKTTQQPKSPSAQLTGWLERMVRIAAHSGHAPMALIAINVGEHDWLQHDVGFGADTSEGSKHRQKALIQFLVAQVGAARQLLSVADISEHPLPPNANASASIAAFLAIPLIGAHQQVVGCLAVLDAHPHPWSDKEIAALQDLAALTVEQVTEQARNSPISMESQAGSGNAVEGASYKTAPTFPAATQEKETKSETQNVARDSVDGVQIPVSGTIVVVDDSETNRMLLRRRLEREGYRVVTAGNGQEALVLLETEAVGLMLLDVMMPEMDGEEVLQHMQQDARLRNIPVIVVTALDEQASVQRCLQAGAKDYILKPFDPIQLRARVRAYLPPPPQMAS